MSEYNLYELMRSAVLEGDEEKASQLALQVAQSGLDPVMAMEEGFLKGLQAAGELYQQGEYYLPDLICSAEAMKTALNILKPSIDCNRQQGENRKKIIMATVQGDIHDIGKTIVASMLTAAGFEVIDLGADVQNEKIIETVQQEKPDFLGLSALLTTTMEEQKNIIHLLEKNGLRKNVKVIVGGAPVSKQWADKIGADGYGENAIEAVKLVNSFFSA